MTETRFYEPARLSTPPKPFFSLKPLDTNLVEVIVIYGLLNPSRPLMISCRAPRLVTRRSKVLLLLRKRFSSRFKRVARRTHVFCACLEYYL